MDITVFNIALVPVLVGLVQVAKITGLKPRWLPLLSVVLGVLVLLGAQGFTGEAILTGIVAGLGAVGLHQFSTKVVGGK